MPLLYADSLKEMFDIMSTEHKDAFKIGTWTFEKRFTAYFADKPIKFPNIETAKAYFLNTYEDNAYIIDRIIKLKSLIKTELDKEENWYTTEDLSTDNENKTIMVNESKSDSTTLSKDELKSEAKSKSESETTQETGTSDAQSSANSYYPGVNRVITDDTQVPPGISVSEGAFKPNFMSKSGVRAEGEEKITGESSNTNTSTAEDKNEIHSGSKDTGYNLGTQKTKRVLYKKAKLYIDYLNTQIPKLRKTFFSAFSFIFATGYVPQQKR